MKANELMIGDYLMHNGFPYRVIQVDGIVRDGWMIENGEEDCGEPIPITLEILEKNGFKPYIPENHLETVYACQDVSKAVADELYALWPYPDGSFYLLLRVDGKDMVRMDVRYVHKLQHALRLCSVSKEIEL